MLDTTLVTQQLDHFISQGWKNYESLYIQDKEKMTVLYMEALGTDAYTVVSHVEEPESIVFHLKEFLSTGRMADGVHVVNALRRNAISYVESKLEDLFDERYEEYQREKKTQSNL